MLVPLLGLSLYLTLSARTPYERLQPLVKLISTALFCLVVTCAGLHVLSQRYLNVVVVFAVFHLASPLVQPLNESDGLFWRRDLVIRRYARIFGLGSIGHHSGDARARVCGLALLHGHVVHNDACPHNHGHVLLKPQSTWLPEKGVATEKNANEHLDDLPDALLVLAKSLLLLV